ncbi:hypothetical protein DFJ63DRAFT_342039 [Scheffersomyces coipomensis]|uniref:uncharacterized protein n=1 Tax=Scheffersomyces coipomensis TaxID=1788519 RepID=UPI00315D1DE5
MTETIKKARVYIKNINFETTEKELEEFLKPFEPYGGAYRPLGVAYAEFKNSESVQKVIKQLDGKMLKNRTLNIKEHLPLEYSRKHFGFRRFFQKEQSKKGSTDDDDTTTTTTTKPNEVSNPITSKSNNLEKDDGNKLSNDDEEGDEKVTSATLDKSKELSTDTIYIPRAYYKVTDEVIRDYFKDYCPSQIYIYRSKLSTQGTVGFHRGHVSVLATLDTSVHSITDIIKDLTKKKLVGRHVPLRVAFKSKIEEVKKVAISKVVNSDDDVLEISNPPSSISVDSKELNSPKEDVEHIEGEVVTDNQGEQEEGEVGSSST